MPTSETISIIALVLSAIAGLYTAVAQSKINQEKIEIDKRAGEAAHAATIVSELQGFAEMLQGRVSTLTCRVVELEKQRAADAQTIQALTVELTEWKIKAAQLESDFAEMSEKYEHESSKWRKRVAELEKERR